MKTIRESNARRVSMRIAVAAIAAFSAATLNAASKASAPSKPAAAAPRPAPKATPAPAGHGAAPPAGRATVPANSRPAGPAGRGLPARAPARAGEPARERPGMARSEGVSRTPNGGEIHRGADGRIREVHARGMEIRHDRSRTVVRERPGHELVVSNRFGHGYIQHPYAYRGAAFVHRTYYVNAVAYARVYRPYEFRGVSLAVYAPGVFYAPAFYGWVYNPWITPVAYPWGWAGNPWFAYYGTYFTPYPVYANASLWLTDYLVSQTLQAAYQERAADSAAAPANFTPMTPEVKQAISEEVRRQIALENSEAAAGAQAPPDPGSSGIARMLDDNTRHVFVVDQPLDVQSNAGECAISQGDVLQLAPGTPPGAASASLMVLASKGQDCRRGAIVEAGIADLQEMQNHMRETIDRGLEDLQKKQGRSGLPAAPAAAVAPPVQTAFAAVAPPPDPNVATELAQQSKEADLAEQETLGQTDNGAALASLVSPATPARMAKELSLGLSPEEVVAIQGQPKETVDLGSKKIFLYDNLKITFGNGKATDIR